MKKPPKKKTRKQLVKDADKFFSLAVRLRDSVNGYGKCITCNKRIHVKDAHCGHFMSRRHLNTRWDEENCNLQCAGCNTFRYGEQYKYGLAVDDKYGAGTAAKLAKAAQLKVIIKSPQLEEIIADAKEEIKFYEQEKAGIRQTRPRTG